jgi:hypothetical protein
MTHHLLIRTGLLFAMTLFSACKDENQSKLDADSQKELVTRTAQFSEFWDDGFITKFRDLPTSGQSTLKPYSGHWYPMVKEDGRSGIPWGTNMGRDHLTTNPSGASPIRKYDLAFYGGATDRAAQWEIVNHTKNHPETTSVSNFPGHCNGVAAAAARHQEPRQPVVRNGITFTPQDLKALLAEIYMSASYRMIAGDKCEENQIRMKIDSRANKQIMDSCEDTNPGSFHVGLANWVGRKQQVIILDTEANEEIWNYAVYAYSVVESRAIDESLALKTIGTSSRSYKEINPNAMAFQKIQVIVYLADHNTEKEILGRTIEKKMTYDYILELNGAGDIIGGEWTTKNKNEKTNEKYPDFVWIAFQPREDLKNEAKGNPYVKVDEVLSMWAESIGYGSLSEAPTLLRTKPWNSDWGIEANGSYYLELDGSRRGTVFISNSDDNQLTVRRTKQGPELDVVHNAMRLVNPEVEGEKATYRFEPTPGINTITICPGVVCTNQAKGQTFYAYGM